MSHPSIQADASRPDLNPVALFHAAPDPELPQAQSFEAQLDRARTAERGQNALPAQASGPNRDSGSMSTADEKATAEVAREQPRQTQPPKAEGAHKEPAKSERTDEGEVASADEALVIEVDQAPAAASPAGLPAEIAAILAALAAIGPQHQRTNANVGDEESLDLLLAEPRGNRIALGISDLFGKLGKGGDPASQFGGQANGKTTGQGESLILKTGGDLRDTQSLTLAAQSGAGRNPADALLGASARADAAQPASHSPAALTGTFAARLESAQQTPPQLPVTTPVGQRGWGAEIGNRIAWMVGRNESKADLMLTPPSLGKLGVSIQVNGDQTSAHFVAATQAARDALEQAMPRLREILQQAGINLGQTSVGTSGDQAPGDGRETHGRSGPANSAEPTGATVEGISGSTGANWTGGGSGVIDTFA